MTLLENKWLKFLLFVVFFSIDFCLLQLCAKFLFKTQDKHFEYVQKPIISVIVPVYNSEQWIVTCLESILKQTVENIKVICVDDGSTDKSLEFLKKIANNDSRVLVIHQENCGPSCARNTGIAAAEGEYVTFVDSDDWIEPNTYEVGLSRGRESNADIVCWGWIDESTKNKFIPKEMILLEKEIIHFLHFYHNNGCAVWNRLYRLSILKKNNITFENVLRFGEDALFNFDFLPYVNSVHLIHEVFYHYSHLPSGINKVHLDKLNTSVADFAEVNRLLHDTIRVHKKMIEENPKCISCAEEMDIKDFKKEYFQKCVPPYHGCD